MADRKENQPPKRAVSPSAEQQKYPKRKPDPLSHRESPLPPSSGESSRSSAPAIFNEMAGTESPHRPQPDISLYYAGFARDPLPTLLAKSAGAVWPPPATATSHFDQYGYSRKLSFVISNHPLAKQLEDGLRLEIRRILASLIKAPAKLIAIDYLRMGYDEEETQNPPTILVRVEKGRVEKADAEHFVAQIKAACDKVDLLDVQVEVMECVRNNTTKDIILGEREPLNYPQDYPLVGSSMAPGREHSEIQTGVGTLGGFIFLDEKVYALTNHHVCFGKYRQPAFPTTEEEGTATTMEEPAPYDLKARITEIEAEKKASSDQTVIDICKLQLERYQPWAKNDCAKTMFGKVFKTSGMRVANAPVGQCFRLDWGLVEPTNLERTPNPALFVNKIPEYNLQKMGGDSVYSRAGLEMALGEKDLTTKENLPTHLKRYLTYDEMKRQQTLAESKTSDSHYICWKFGRSTHHTFGIVSEIQTDYVASNGQIIDVLLVKDPHIKDPSHPGVPRRYPFSTAGDSGSFVWDTNGYVFALLWGGCTETYYSYCSPIETILNDIKEVCGAEKVKLVVRPEEDNDDILDSQSATKQLGLEETEGGFMDEDVLAAAMAAGEDEEEEDAEKNEKETEEAENKETVENQA